VPPNIDTVFKVTAFGLGGVVGVGCAVGVPLGAVVGAGLLPQPARRLAQRRIERRIDITFFINFPPEFILLTLNPV
jgi:hypothetical protein